MPTMNLTDHYHFLMEELEETRSDLIRTLNRGGSKKRPGTSLSHAQHIMVQKVFNKRRNRLKSLIILEDADEAMRKIND